MPNDDDIRGQSSAMSTKDLLLELYHDMKFVRPAVEGLLAAGLATRIEVLERDRLVLSTAKTERNRIGDMTNKTIVIIVLVSNFVLGLVISIANNLRA